MSQSARQMVLEDVFIDLRASEPDTTVTIRLAGDGSADVRFPEDDAALAEARAVLSIPIRSGAGAVGTVHLVGPHAADVHLEDDARLRAFAADVGTAYDRFLRRDGDGAARARRLRALVGLALVSAGLALVLAAGWGLGARALPLSRLPSRPGVWPGAALTGCGLLLGLARRRRAGA